MQFKCPDNLTDLGKKEFCHRGLQINTDASPGFPICVQLCRIRGWSVFQMIVAFRLFSRELARDVHASQLAAKRNGSLRPPEKSSKPS
jgi:hypothetical protein